MRGLQSWPIDIYMVLLMRHKKTIIDSIFRDAVLVCCPEDTQPISGWPGCNVLAPTPLAGLRSHEKRSGEAPERMLRFFARTCRTSN